MKIKKRLNINIGELVIDVNYKFDFSILPSELNFKYKVVDHEESCNCIYPINYTTHYIYPLKDLEDIKDTDMKEALSELQFKLEILKEYIGEHKTYLYFICEDEGGNRFKIEIMFEYSVVNPNDN